MKYVKNTTILSIFILMIACSDGTEKADGYGNFEATETIISSETNGKIMQFNIEEGSMLIENTFIGYIDTVQLSLKRDQLLISKKILASKSISVLSQIAVLEAKLQS